MFARKKAPQSDPKIVEIIKLIQLTFLGHFALQLEIFQWVKSSNGTRRSYSVRSTHLVQRFAGFSMQETSYDPNSRQKL